MAALKAPQRHAKAVSGVRNVAVSFLDALDAGELLTGTPTIVEVTTSDLTLTNKAINTATITINGVSHLAGQALQFAVSGGLAGSDYTISLKGSTDATPAQDIYGDVVLKVIAD